MISEDVVKLYYARLHSYANDEQRQWQYTNGLGTTLKVVLDILLVVFDTPEG